MAAAHEKLIVWQKAMEMVKKVYEATRSFPKEEMLGLTSQLRRAAVSVPSNIAEGKGRLSKKEFCYFLGNARGSLLEMATQIRLAESFKYLPAAKTSELIASSDEVGRLINGLLATLRPTQKERNAPTSY